MREVEGRFSIVPLAAACDIRLTDLGYRILGTFASFANKDEQWAAWPAYYVVAEIVGCCSDTVSRWVKRLIEIGYLVSAPTRRKRLRFIVQTAERSPALPAEFDRRLLHTKARGSTQPAEPPFLSQIGDDPQTSKLQKSDSPVGIPQPSKVPSVGIPQQESDPGGAEIRHQGRNPLVFSRRSAADDRLASVPATPWHSKNPDEQRMVYRSWRHARNEVMCWVVGLNLPSDQEDRLWESAPDALTDPLMVTLPLTPNNWQAVCRWWNEQVAVIAAALSGDLCVEASA